MMLNLLFLSVVLSGSAHIIVQVTCNGLGVFGMLVLLGLVVISYCGLYDILCRVVLA